MKKEEKNHRTLQFNITKECGEFYDYCNNITHLAKNIHNVAVYQNRQLMTGLKKEPERRTENENEIIELYEKFAPIVNQKRIEKENAPYDLPSKEKWHPHKYLMSGVMIESHNEDYYAMPPNASQQIIYKQDDEWMSYFKSIKDWKNNPSKYNGIPKPPSYIKDYNFVCTFNNKQAKFDKTNPKIIKFPKRRTDKDLPRITYNIGERKIPTNWKLAETRIVPKKDKTFNLEVIFKTPNPPAAKPKEECKRIVSLDLGVDNFAAITSNFGSEPILISGKTLKSYNRLYNKKNAEYKAILTHGHDPKEKGLQKTSKRINQTTGKRNRRVDDYCHKASRWIVNYCVENKVDCIVIGKNKNWKYGGMEAWCKQEEQRLNQNFVQLPFNKLIDKIKYKAEENGILVIEQEESYTSKACFINQDFIPVFDEKVQIDDSKAFTGYRKTRGLYKVKNSKIVMNADVNGSANILRKAFPNLPVDQTWVSGVLKQPRVVNLFDQA